MRNRLTPEEKKALQKLKWDQQGLNRLGRITTVHKNKTASLSKIVNELQSATCIKIAADALMAKIRNIVESLSTICTEEEFEQAKMALLATKTELKALQNAQLI